MPLFYTVISILQSIYGGIPYDVHKLPKNPPTHLNRKIQSFSLDQSFIPYPISNKILKKFFAAC